MQMKPRSANAELSTLPVGEIKIDTPSSRQRNVIPPRASACQMCPYSRSYREIENPACPLRPALFTAEADSDREARSAAVPPLTARWRLGVT